MFCEEAKRALAWDFGRSDGVSPRLFSSTPTVIEHHIAYERSAPAPSEPRLQADMRTTPVTVPRISNSSWPNVRERRVGGLADRGRRRRHGLLQVPPSDHLGLWGAPLWSTCGGASAGLYRLCSGVLLTRGAVDTPAVLS